MRKVLSFACALIVLTIAFTCSAVAQNGGTKAGGAHVVLIVEENHGYQQTLNPAVMPYFNQLVTRGALATNFFGNTHPSIGNYFMMTTGQIITNDDGFNRAVDVDNLVRQMVAANVSWKSYAQSLPSTGYTGPDQFPYYRRHNPFAYFSDVVNNAAQKANLVSTDQLDRDLASGLPRFTYLVPNGEDDAHDCPGGGNKCSDDVQLAAADNFLNTWVPRIMKDPGFQKDGILIITFDEAKTSDKAHGGGHIPTLLIGPGVKQGFKSNTLFQHQSLERLICDSLGLAKCPGAGASAPSMSEMLQ